MASLNPGLRVYAGAAAVAPGGIAGVRSSGGVQPSSEEAEERDAAVLGAPADEDGPPLDVIVATEQSEVSGIASSAPPVRRKPEDEAVPAPPLSELLPRVPAALQEAMDELFRARFVRVARVPETSTSPATAGRSGA